ncbi:terminase small subunit [Brevundimonas sp. Marseille-Q4549]
MPVLSNAKHERFAQGIAKGLSQTDAYTEAGYKGDRTAASRLSTNVNISKRVAELQGKAAVRTEITVASITERLLAIASKGEASKDAPLLAVARASLMDAAKLNGLVVDKSQAELTGAEGAPLGVSVTFRDA